MFLPAERGHSPLPQDQRFDLFPTTLTFWWRVFLCKELLNVARFCNLRLRNWLQTVEFSYFVDKRVTDLSNTLENITPQQFLKLRSYCSRTCLQKRYYN